LLENELGPESLTYESAQDFTSNQDK
jgi:hypothetical protein